MFQGRRTVTPSSLLFFSIRQILDRLLVPSLHKVSVSLGHRCVRVADEFSDDVHVDFRVDHMGDERIAQVVEMPIFDARAASRIFVGVDYTHVVAACKKPIIMGKNLKFSNTMIKKNNIIPR